MADREHSPSYAAALKISGKRVLRVIEHEIEHSGDGVAISLEQFMAHGMCRAAARYGIKQCECVGFITVAAAARRVNTFAFCDGWRALDADEAARRVKQAKLPKPQRADSEPVPPKPVKPPKVERPRFSQRRMPSLPSMPWQDDGR